MAILGPDGKPLCEAVKTEDLNTTPMQIYCLTVVLGSTRSISTLLFVVKDNPSYEEVKDFVEKAAVEFGIRHIIDNGDGTVSPNITVPANEYSLLAVGRPNLGMTSCIASLQHIMEGKGFLVNALPEVFDLSKMDEPHIHNDNCKHTH